MARLCCRCTKTARQQEATAQAAAAPFPKAAAAGPPEVTLRVCREGRALSVDVRLARENGLGTARLVHWCGAQIQVRGAASAHVAGLRYMF